MARTNVNALFAKAIESQPEREQNCWPPAPCACRRASGCRWRRETAELTGDEAEDAASGLVNGSLLRVCGPRKTVASGGASKCTLCCEMRRTRQGGDGLGKLQERHAVALEELF